MTPVEARALFDAIAAEDDCGLSDWEPLGWYPNATRSTVLVKDRFPDAAGVYRVLTLDAPAAWDAHRAALAAAATAQLWEKQS